MRVWRASVFIDPGPPPGPPFTTVTSDSDLRVPLEEAIAYSDNAEMSEVFIIHDIFEMPSAPLPTMVKEATRRAKPQAESDMAVLFFDTVTQWRYLHEGGVVASERPAPLSVKQIEYVYERLKKHPAYKGYRSMTMAEDGTWVRL